MKCPACGDERRQESAGSLWGRSERAYQCAVCHQLYLDSTPPDPPALSDQERDLLSLTVAGMVNKQIARELGVSLRTVHLRRHGLMMKLGATNKAHLIRLATERGLLQPATAAPRASDKP
ncbi:MAG TPA: helix-turn-helix transcriptional regulator [Pirellulales bacterium]|nr:helix-turn-helix transcriptional regulator [Pirellulales bacterium]